MAADRPRSAAFRRSGSQRRQRNHAIKVALNDNELAEVQQRARATGLSASSFGRASMLGTPGPRAQRTPPIHAELLARAIAALNKVGSNLNQMAHALNAGGAMQTAQECFAALAETRAAAAAIRQIVGRKNRP